MSSDKQPLIHGQTPSAPPPMYQPPMQAPPYTPGPPMGYGGTQPNPVVILQPAKVSYSTVDIKPPNYLVLSIITMLFFCWVFGLIALIVGSQVDSAWVTGDLARARRQSSQARMWNIVGMVIGVLIYVALVVLSVAINASACYNC